MSSKHLFTLCTLSALLCSPFSASAVRRRSGSLPLSPRERRRADEPPRAPRMNDAPRSRAMHRHDDIECGGVCCCCPSAECGLGTALAGLIVGMMCGAGALFQQQAEKGE